MTMIDRRWLLTYAFAAAAIPRTGFAQSGLTADQMQQGIDRSRVTRGAMYRQESGESQSVLPPPPPQAAPASGGAATGATAPPEPVAPIPTPSADAGRQVAFEVPILFDLNSYALRPGYAPLLQDMSGVLLRPRNSDLNFYVVGHTDSTGGYRHNLELSQQRAARIVWALRSLGVPAGRLVAIGMGPDDPLPGLARTSPANRRVMVETARRL